MTDRTFDGRADLVAMEVPVTGRASRTVLIRGEGLPDLIGVGAVDLPDDRWLSIENRGREGPLYSQVGTIRQGVLALAGTVTKSAMLRGGHTLGHGASARESAGGRIVPTEPGGAACGTASWIGVKEDGTAFMVVANVAWDSFQLRAALAPHVAGTFHLQHLWAGTYQAAPDLPIFGWDVAMSAPVEPVLAASDAASEMEKAPRSPRTPLG